MDSTKDLEKDLNLKSEEDFNKIANLFNDKINNLEKILTELVKKPDGTDQNDEKNIFQTSNSSLTNSNKEKFKEQVWEKLKEKYLLNSSLDSLSDNEKALKEYLDISLNKQHDLYLKEIDSFKQELKNTNNSLNKEFQNQLINNIQKVFNNFKVVLQQENSKEIGIHNENIKKNIELLEFHYFENQENLKKLKKEIDDSIKASDLEEKFKIFNSEMQNVNKEILNLKKEIKSLNEQKNSSITEKKLEEFKNSIIKSTKEDIETNRWLQNQEKSQNDAKIQKELNGLKAEFVEYLDIISALDKKTDNLVSDKTLDEIKNKWLKELDKRNDRRYLKASDFESVLDNIFDKKDEI
ncbi:hypothetical protein [Williamsoniiplasma luminosum]|uniref:Uncharacterized protein n=1 Tax=Williamsoniiplasma luminosum TaxID=214888 RepID=A0A2S0NJL3_9MOLU|nr:hypothetical protein [Williamsoniiplasma luminosum]AVP49196.1 MAG: hypothetical protein C5T88_01180 [Williamsoniiplasma luminosum]